MLQIIIRIGLFVIPWTSVLFLPKKSFIRYFPVAIFTALLILIESLFSIPFKWWTSKGGLKTKIVNDLCFIFGPFFIGTIWIFRLTYGKFWLYLFLNVVMDAFLSFPMNSVFQKLKVYKLINFKPKHIFYTSIVYSLMIYRYQMFMDRSSH